MTTRCAQCAWDNFLKTRDMKNAIRQAGSAGGFMWQGTSLCENHMAAELIGMEKQILARKAQAEADAALQASTPVTVAAPEADVTAPPGSAT